MDLFAKPGVPVSRRTAGKSHVSLNHASPNTKPDQKSIPGGGGGPGHSSAQPPYAPKHVNYVLPPWSLLPPRDERGGAVSSFAVQPVSSGTELAHWDLVATTRSLRRSWLSVGRVDECDITLLHGSISRDHAIIQWRWVPSGVSVFPTKPGADDGEVSISPTKPGADDGEVSVSQFLQQHVVLDGRWEVVIIDRGSTHGTFLNKTRLKPRVPYVLRDGNMLSFGSSTRKYFVRAPVSRLTPTAIRNPTVRALVATGVMALSSQHTTPTAPVPNEESEHGSEWTVMRKWTHCQPLIESTLHIGKSASEDEHAPAMRSRGVAGGHFMTPRQEMKQRFAQMSRLHGQLQVNRKRLGSLRYGRNAAKKTQTERKEQMQAIKLENETIMRDIQATFSAVEELLHIILPDADMPWAASKQSDKNRTSEAKSHLSGGEVIATGEVGEGLSAVQTEAIRILLESDSDDDDMQTTTSSVSHGESADTPSDNVRDNKRSAFWARIPEDIPPLPTTIKSDVLQEYIAYMEIMSARVLSRRYMLQDRLVELSLHRSALGKATDTDPTKRMDALIAGRRCVKDELNVLRSIYDTASALLEKAQNLLRASQKTHKPAPPKPITPAVDNSRGFKSRKRPSRRPAGGGMSMMEMVRHARAKLQQKNRMKQMMEQFDKEIDSLTSSAPSSPPEPSASAPTTANAQTASELPLPAESQGMLSAEDMPAFLVSMKSQLSQRDKRMRSDARTKQLAGPTPHKLQHGINES